MYALTSVANSLNVFKGHLSEDASAALTRRVRHEPALNILRHVPDWDEKEDK